MAKQTSATIKVVYNHLPKLPAEIEAGVKDEIKKAGFDIEARAKSLTPVLTGTLRRSITTQIKNDGMSAVVGPSVDYGFWVEMGSRGRAARPYMRPAAAAVYPRFIDNIKALLRGLK